MFQSIEEKIISILTNKSVESRNLDFKKALPFEDLKFKILKALIAFSNTKGGGILLIGVEEDDSGQPFVAGISEEILATYNHDKIKDLDAKVNSHISVSTHIISFENKKVIALNVSLSSRLPVLPTTSNEKEKIKAGQLYHRSIKGRPSSSEIVGEEEIAEFLRLYISSNYSERDKAIDEELKRLDTERRTLR